MNLMRHKGHYGQRYYMAVCCTEDRAIHAPDREGTGLAHPRWHRARSTMDSRLHTYVLNRFAWAKPTEHFTS